MDPLALAYHELRAPLGLVATAASAAASECGDEVTRSRCEVILRVAERMLRTSNQVYTAARSGASSAPAWYSPGEIIDSLAADLHDLAVPITFQMTGAAASIRAHGVREQFEALLQSIVNNALDHGEPGAEVTVRLVPLRDRFEVSVENVIAGRIRHHGGGLGSYIAETLARQLGAELTSTRAGRIYTMTLRVPTGAGTAASLEQRSA
jgi:signal transduction histidine kinase